MGLLARNVLAAGSLATAASACYSPELRDCTVACTTGDDCADGQVCGSDHFCAGPDVRCATGAKRDASVSATGDGSVEVPVDAYVPPDAPPDAPTEGILTIAIAGHGTVYVQNIGECEYEAAPCQFVVPLDRDVFLAALAPNDWRFDEWNAGPCNHSKSPGCLFEPSLATNVSAKFRKD